MQCSTYCTKCSYYLKMISAFYAYPWVMVTLDCHFDVTYIPIMFTLIKMLDWTIIKTTAGSLSGNTGKQESVSSDTGAEAVMLLLICYMDIMLWTLWIQFIKISPCRCSWKTYCTIRQIFLTPYSWKKVFESKDTNSFFFLTLPSLQFLFQDTKISEAAMMSHTVPKFVETWTLAGKAKIFCNVRIPHSE